MPMNTLEGRDLLTLADLTPDEVRLVLDRAVARSACGARPQARGRASAAAAAIII